MRLLTAALGCCLCVTVLSGGLVFAASSESEADTRLAIVDKYVDATQIQQNSLRGLQMQVDIDAKLPKLEKHGKLLALRKISRLGLITYKALGFSGDNTVKQEVITRYLAAESAARENGTIAITPANYKFRFAGEVSTGGTPAYIYRITPKRGRRGLLKGQIWIDSDSGTELMVSGRVATLPSIHGSVEVVRETRLLNGSPSGRLTHVMFTLPNLGRAEVVVTEYLLRPRDSGTNVEGALSASMR